VGVLITVSKRLKLSRLVVVILIVNFIFLSGTTNNLPIAENRDNQSDSPNLRDYSIWSSAELVSVDSTVNCLRPDITVDNERNVHIVYQDGTNIDSSGTDHDIHYRFWNESNSAWTTTQVLSVGSNVASEAPRIKADESGNLHVIWFDWTAAGDSDIYHAFWNKTTGVWGSPVLVSTMSTAQALWPDIDVKNGEVYLVWQDLTNILGAGSGDHDIFFMKRFLNGTWSSVELVTSESSLLSRFPSIAVDDNFNVHVSWDDATNYGGAGGDEDVFYKYRNSTTGSWTTTQVVSTESGSDSQRSKIVIDKSDNLHIVWFDITNYNGAGIDRDIFYKRWNSNTSSWTSTEVISTESSSASEVPTLLVDDIGNLHCFWFDITNINGAGIDQDIFYKKWDISTSSWDGLKVLTDSSDDSWRPQVTIDSKQQIHLTWMDRTVNYLSSGSDIDIFYSKGIDPNLIAELSFTYSPNNVIYEINSTGHQLTWTLLDENVSNPTYVVYRNGTELTNQTWISEVAINFNIDGLSIGVYNYTFVATDGLDHFVTDVVIVTVVAEGELSTGIELGPIFDMIYGVIAAFGIVTITAFIPRRKKT
jgi:hypothetical protein